MIQILVNNVVVAEITLDGVIHDGNAELKAQWKEILKEEHYDISHAGEGRVDFIEQREFEKTTEWLYATRFNERFGVQFRVVN